MSEYCRFCGETISEDDTDTCHPCAKKNKYHTKWRARFKTKNSCYHPVWFSYERPVFVDKPQKASEGYLKDNAHWLKSIDDISPWFSTK